MKSRALARAGAAKSIALERAGKKGKLRMSLEVRADPQGYRTRLGYYADLFLKLDGPGQEGGPEPEECHIGYISSWRLSKQPDQYGHEEFQPWVTEWLHSELGGPDDESRPFKETLRLLYEIKNDDGQVEAGQVKARKVKAGQVRDNMTDDLVRFALDETGSELVLIEMLWIKYKDDTTGFQVSVDCGNSTLGIRRLIAQGPVLSPGHCITCLRTTLLTYE